MKLQTYRVPQQHTYQQKKIVALTLLISIPLKNNIIGDDTYRVMVKTNALNESEKISDQDLKLLCCNNPLLTAALPFENLG